MASVAKDARDGRDGWRVRFYVGPNRRELYFKGRKRDADELARNCEALASSKAAGMSPDPQLVAWVRRLDLSMVDALVRWGLCEPMSPKLSKDEGKYLGPFIADYIASRSDLKSNTRKNLIQTKRVLLEYFGDRRPLRSIRPSDALAWQRWLQSDQGLSVATISGHTRKVKTMIKAAVVERLIESSPFDGLKGGKESNVDRQRFISRDVIDRILSKCPGPQWRLIVVLCRYAGLRCPSEVLRLRWTDLDWDRGSMRIDSTKTGLRVVPMFPEVRKALQDAWEAAPDGAVRCIDGYDEKTPNLRTQFNRILSRAHVEPWPRIFHNLRASCRTELQESLPDHVINSWLGQSSRVAETHYLTVHQEHWDRALNLTPNCPPTRPPVGAISGPIGEHQGNQKTNVLIGDDGMGYLEEHPGQDSNDNQKGLGKPHLSEVVPPPVPPSLYTIPLELVELWPTLTDAQQAELMQMARAMACQVER
jgi:integrase